MVRDVATRGVVAHFRAHESPIAFLAFDPSGAPLAPNMCVCVCHVCVCVCVSCVCVCVCHASASHIHRGTC